MNSSNRTARRRTIKTPRSTAQPGDPPRVRRPKQSRSRSNAEALLDAGLRCISEQGIEGTMMSKVARDAGTSVGALYFRFGDKETFINAALQRGFDRIRAETSLLLGRAHEENVPAEEVIRRFLSWAVDVMIDNQGLFRAVLKRALVKPEEWDPVGQLGVDSSAILVETLRQYPSITGIADWERKLLFGVHAARSAVFLSDLKSHAPLPADRATLSEELARLVLAYLHA